MASITLTIDNAEIPRMISTFEHQFGVKPVEESDNDFVKRHVISLLQRWTQTTEVDIARKSAMANYVAVDIT